MTPRVSRPPPVSVLALLALLLLAGSTISARDLDAQAPDAPYVPTPMEVVSTMLEVADPTPRDTVYDLGSGDGRLVVEAAKRYGATGVGVEIQEHLNERARRDAGEAGVDDRVRFVEEDLFGVDLSSVTVLTLYLSRRINQELRPKILEQMRPGSRVVSHAFDMGPWRADSLVQMPEELALVYLWVVPANVTGRWKLDLPSGEEVTFRLDQRFQQLRVVQVDGPGGIEIADPALRGDTVWLTLVRRGAEGSERRTAMVGVVRGDRMYGNAETGERWRAIRTSGAGRPLDEWSVEPARPPPPR